MDPPPSRLMQERAKLLHMAQNEAERLIIAKALDKARQAEMQGQLALGDFHDPAQLAVLQRVMRHRRGEARLFSFGGFNGAERTRVCLAPEDLAPGYNDFALSVVSLTPRSKGAKLEHRAVLGSMMSLGIKRDKIGDVVILDTGAFVIVDSAIAEQIGMDTVGSEPVSVDLRGLDVLKGYEPVFVSATVTVASMRLDALVAAIYRLSRADAAALISRGLVKVNHVPTAAVAHEVKEGELLSVRGKGRAKVNRLLGNTQKGRLRLEILKPE